MSKGGKIFIWKNARNATRCCSEKGKLSLVRLDLTRFFVVDGVFSYSMQKNIDGVEIFSYSKNKRF